MLARLDQRVTFQTRSSASDGMGGSAPAWADFTSTPTVWASVKPVSGREAMEDDRNNARLTMRVTVRYRADVSEGDRLLWRAEPYNIRAVHRTTERDMYLRLDCERGATSGA